MVTADASFPQRFSVYWVDLDPTRGHELRKTRPAVIISPDELNRRLRTVIIAPLTTQSHVYPFRISCRIHGRDGYIVLDQLRTVDKIRLGDYMGDLDVDTQAAALHALAALFAP